MLIIIKDKLNFSYMLKKITSLKKFYVISEKDDIFKSGYEKSCNDTINNNFKYMNNISNNETENEKGSKIETGKNKNFSFYDNISKRNSFTINEISEIVKTSSNVNDDPSISKEYNILCSSYYNSSVRKQISAINLSNLFNGCSSLELIKDIN